MGKEERIAKEFSENVDRMLASKEAKISPTADYDYRTALDFTRRLIEMRVAPRPAFQAQLKDRLLARVRQPEVKEGSFWVALHHVLYSPVWRTVTATVVVALLAAGVMWGRGVFTPDYAVSDRSMETQGETALAPPSLPDIAGTAAISPQDKAAALETAPAMAAAPPPVTATATPAPAPPPKVTVTATPTPTPSPPLGGTVPTPVPAPTPAPGISFPPLDVKATIGKSAYLPGEEVKMEFFFKNTSPSTIQIYPFPPQVDITRPRSSEPVRSIPGGTGDKLVSPDEVASYAVTWDQRDSQGQPVGYGYYFIEMGSFRAQSPISSGDVRMKPSFGMQSPILILPVEGVLEKTIAINRAQTENGVTITLERVEMSVSGLNVYTFATPPGYRLPQGPQLPSPAMLIHAEGAYSLDGAAVKETGPSAVRFLENGMQFIWKQLDPVPKNTKELVFRITKLGEQSGPWEFRIPLQ